MDEKERQELMDRFWTLLEPDLTAYSRWLDKLLREIPIERLKEIVKDMEG